MDTNLPGQAAAAVNKEIFVLHRRRQGIAGFGVDGNRDIEDIVFIDVDVVSQLR